MIRKMRPQDSPDQPGGMPTDGIVFRMGVVAGFVVLLICYISGVNGTYALLAFAGTIVAVVALSVSMMLITAPRGEDKKRAAEIRDLSLLS